MSIFRYIRVSFCLVFMLIAASLCCAGAPDSEASRVLVHTLTYIGSDYPNGVANGKVISEDEYTENLGFCASAEKFYREDAHLWSPADSARIGALIEHLIALVHAKAPLDEVSTAANAAEAEVIRASGLTVSPTAYPSLMNGKAVFAAQCAKCHGSSGLGDGKEGEKLDPRPRNFHEETRMALMSPFSVYNTVRCGVQGTGMKSHPDLSDEQVWDVAFYVLTLRYPQPDMDRTHAADLIRGRFGAISLREIATTADKELAARYKAAKPDIAALRYDQPGDTKGQFIDAALLYIDESMTACRDGRYDDAERLSNLAYLEGIEPIEKQLRSTDPALMERLEEQMANTRHTIAAHRDKAEVNDSLKESKRLITLAAQSISTTGMSFWLAMLMAISILLREGLEAFLVIMVILGIIKASGVTSSMRYVHAGWIIAVLSGVVMWVIGGQIIQAHMAQVELMEGIIALVAVAMLLYIGFWLHGKSEISKWRAYVSGQVRNLTGSGSITGLFALSFFVVFREVFESVLFLSAINIESGGRQQNAIVLGVLLAFVLVVSLAWLALRFSARLPVPRLFRISSVVMGALAVILAGKGIHSFQETGHVSIHGIAWLPHAEIMELMGMFPTVETLLAQAIVLGITIYVLGVRKETSR